MLERHAVRLRNLEETKMTTAPRRPRTSRSEREREVARGGKVTVTTSWRATVRRSHAEALPRILVGKISPRSTHTSDPTMPETDTKTFAAISATGPRGSAG